MDDVAPYPKQATGSTAYARPVEFQILGPVRVLNNGEAVPVGGPKQRSILALLVANVGQPVSLDRIVDGIYGDEASDGARHSVQTYISTIRRDLGDIVRKDPGGYVLTVDADSIDAVRFEDAVRAALAATADEPETASAALREALAMWRGHAYADVDGWGVFEPEITRLSELRLSALEARIDADLALGRHRELIGELDVLTAEHPLRERFRAQQMLALYRAGRQTESLRAYERTRAYLSEEIGIDPSPGLRELEQRILDHDPELEVPSAPSLAQRAVVVLDLADLDSLARLDPAARASMVDSVSRVFGAAVERHHGEGFGQRGSALYAAFPAARDAVGAVGEVMAAESATVRIAIDHGDVEIQDTGEVQGPPVRRVAGLVAAAHGGQVLLSSHAQDALLDERASGWLVRSLGEHSIHGVDAPQQVFQLVLDGRQAEFPPLLRDATPPPQPADRSAVAGYELRAPLSSDLSGTSYRAYQPSVGREVVVTAIDPAWSNDPVFISRFEVETQLVARLQHPHLVPLLDYWRDPTGAFLVTPMVSGITLAEGLANGIDDEQRGRMVVQVGEALSHAHRLGVVHGAVSSSTVAIDESGNAYLNGASFITRLAAAPAAAGPSAPPELVRGDPITAATDVYGLGHLAGQLLDGSSGLAAIVARATADLPDERFATVDELLTELADELGRPRPSYTETRNPYKGLEAFGEADADDFFGRTGDVEALAALLAEHRLVVVVGPSGSGKSSLVKAGLIPALRRWAAGSDQPWLVTDCFPGSYPFVELESALARVAVEDPGIVMDELDRDEHGLVRVVKRILPEGTRLLLVIDQFEELFTLTRDDLARERFLTALVELAADERSDTRVIVTLRGDFFDRPLQYPEFGELVKAATFALTTPAPAELAEAIRRPAEGVGVVWEPGLVEQIVDDVADEPGTLPLLQYALTELFSARDRDELGHEAYRSCGGVLGALGTQADAVYDALDPGQQAIARRLFLRLVSVQPSGEETRRRARLLELNAIADPAKVGAVLTAFGGARLLTFDRDPVTRGPTAEVAHEALLTRWPRLAEWIGEAREDLLLHHRLAEAVEEWDRGERDDAFLLAGGRLAQFQAWADTTELGTTPIEAEFLALSTARAEAERARRRRMRNLVTAGLGTAAVVAAVLGIVAFASRQDAAESAGIAQSRALAASAISVLDDDPELSLLLALQAADAADPTIESISAVHESLAAHDKILTYTWPADRELRQDLSTRLSPDGRLLVASGGGTYVEVVDVDTGQRVWGRDLGGEGIARALFTPDGSDVVVTYGWSPNFGPPELDAATEGLLGVHVLDAATGDSFRHLPVGICGVVSVSRPMATVGNSEAAFLVAEVGDDPACPHTGANILGANAGDVGRPPTTLIDLSTGDTEQLSPLRPGPNDAPGAWVSADGGTTLVVDHEGLEAGPPMTRVIDRTSGEQTAVLPGWPMEINADGTVALTYAGELLTWDLTGGQPGEPLASRTSGGFGSAGLSPAGDTVIELTDANFTLWDARTGDESGRLLTGLGNIDKPFYNADGSRLVVSDGIGGNAVVFDFVAPRELATLQLCDVFYGAMLDVVGDVAAVHAACDDTNLRTQFLIDSNSFTVTNAYQPSGGARTGVLSPDGSTLADQSVRPHDPGAATPVDQVVTEFFDTGSDPGPDIFGEIELHDAATGDVLATLPGMCLHGFGQGPDCGAFPDGAWPDYVLNVAFSPDGTLLATVGDNSDGIAIYDVNARQLLTTVQVEHDIDQPYRGADVAFSPDGSRLAASFGYAPYELWLLSTADWTPIAGYDASTDGAPSQSLVFTPDGATLIATDAEDGEGRIVFLDGSTLEVLGEIPDAHDAPIRSLDLNEDGTLLASSGFDGFVRVWDVETRTLVHQIPVGSTLVDGVAFMDDENHLAAAHNGAGQLLLLTIDNEELLDIARARVTRGFTDTECATYAIDPCPTFEEIRGG